jgi:hypothetical protein
MRSRSNFIFGPFTDLAWKRPKNASHTGRTVARHLFDEMPRAGAHGHHAGQQRPVASTRARPPPSRLCSNVESPELVALAGSLSAACRSLPRAARARSAMAAIASKPSSVATALARPLSLLHPNRPHPRLSHSALPPLRHLPGRVATGSRRRRNPPAVGPLLAWPSQLGLPRAKTSCPLGAHDFPSAPPPLPGHRRGHLRRNSELPVAPLCNS